VKKVIGIIVIILLIPVVIYVIKDIDRTPIYPTTEFNIEKLTRISSLDIENGIELPKLPNGVGDRWLSDGRVERNVSGKVVLDSSENWGIYPYNTELPNATIAFYSDGYYTEKDDGYKHFINNILTNGNVYRTDIGNRIDLTGTRVVVRLFKSDLVEYGYDDSMTDEQKVNAFKSWLSQNPLIIYYLLATPTFDNSKILPEYIDFYDSGSVIVDDGIVDYTVVGNQAQINYIEGNITTVVDGQFKISKPTKIISKSNNLYDYDLFTLPNYLEYGTLSQDTYNNTLEFINNNQNKQIKIFFDDSIQESRYNIYLENDTIIINNDTEVIRIYNNDTYTSTRNLNINIIYKLEGYNILDYIDGKFDNTVLAFFWVIPALLAGGLIYLALKRKE